MGCPVSDYAFNPNSNIECTALRDGTKKLVADPSRHFHPGARVRVTRASFQPKGKRERSTTALLRITSDVSEHRRRSGFACWRASDE